MRLFKSVLMRRLYLQIYATIVGSLVLVVILSGLLWEAVGRERLNRNILDTVSRFVALTLPPADASHADQQRTIQGLGAELDIALALFDENGDPIAVYGEPDMPPERRSGETGWFRARGGPILSLALPDGRWLVADAHDGSPLEPLLNLLFTLALVAVCVGIGVYPISRRLAKRLETLSRGVERIGSGDLHARVDVQGQDEVAQLARKFNAAADKIENLVTAHRMLLANASHELRTPLARIKLGLEMDQIDGTQERRAALKRDILELDALIDEILVMSRLDGDMPVERSEPIDLLALIAEECARHDHCSYSGNAPEISGDPRLLHRMLGNLIENAVKHGEPPVTVSLSVSGQTIKIDVIDCGHGITEAECESVFQPFYRGPDKQNVDGYGLGLPLVRKIAEAHGGTAFVVAVPKGSSMIRVSLPLTR
ncbi:HAMP domain-containing sensor histidine kinase [Roseibium sp. HPY-6]|uniref:HAMP domain-containing sensor histidine kinase n=1 Tax=Roseibium sp. HPY-6 TaxID=3229852 RepID=UPI00338D5463